MIVHNPLRPITVPKPYVKLNLNTKYINNDEDKTFILYKLD